MKLTRIVLCLGFACAGMMCAAAIAGNKSTQSSTSAPTDIRQQELLVVQKIFADNGLKIVKYDPVVKLDPKETVALEAAMQKVKIVGSKGNFHAAVAWAEYNRHVAMKSSQITLKAAIDGYQAALKLAKTPDEKAMIQQGLEFAQKALNGLASAENIALPVKPATTKAAASNTQKFKVGA